MFAAGIFEVTLATGVRLSLLTPVHSVNLLVKLLPEQRARRKFAGLRRQTQVPGVRVLHEFRARAGGGGLRRINEHLLAPLLATYLWQPGSVGLIDATESCIWPLTRLRMRRRRSPCCGRRIEG